MSIRPTDNFIHDMTSRVSMRQLHFNHNKQHAGKMNTRINKGKRVCIHRSLIVSRELKVPCLYIRETYSVGRELTIVCQHTEFQKPSNWNVEENRCFVKFHFLDLTVLQSFSKHFVLFPSPKQDKRFFNNSHQVYWCIMMLEVQFIQSPK